MKRDNPEHRLHVAVARYLAAALRPPTIWTTIGHGGGGRVRGAQLKAMGMQRGWPDILVLDSSYDPKIPYTRVVGIELKAGKGRVSEEQQNMADAFYWVNASYAICRSVEDVAALLGRARITLHARIMTGAVNERAA